MEATTKTHYTQYQELFKTCFSILELTSNQFMQKNNSPNIVHTYVENNNVPHTLIEVRFNESGITLFGSYNTELLCDTVLLFPDSINNIKCIIEYLNTNFTYNYIRGVWNHQNYTIFLYPAVDEMHIVIYKS
ncbi:MAG: hypothetical protein ACRDDZ_08760 [Marinifilaceae bacterium]